MYEINTHNLKIYLVVLSLIFFLTNGVPLLTMFDKDTQMYINRYQKTSKYDNLRGENFIMINNNYYDINATVVKHSMMYNTNTDYFTGSVLLEYKNYIDTHQFCKIDIDIEEQKRNDIIYDFIYKYYNLSKNNIKLYCNNNICIHKLYKYEDGKYDEGKIDEIMCNILPIKQLNDEL